MEISYDSLIITLLGIATVVTIIVATVRFVKKHKDPGSELDRQLVQQISFYILIVLLCINAGMAFISAGVEVEEVDEKINPLARWIMHGSLELFGYLCLIAVGATLLYVIYSASYAREYHITWIKSKKKNKEQLKYRNIALQNMVWYFVLLCIYLPVGILGPYSNVLIVSFAYDQTAQFDFWFRDVTPFFLASYDYATVPFSFLKETDLTQADLVQRGTDYYLPADYNPLKDMKLPLQAMCILFAFNIIAGLTKGIVSSAHIIERIKNDMQDKIEGKSTKKRKPSERKEKKKKKQEEKKKTSSSNDTDELEDYLTDILDFYGYEDDELEGKVSTALANFEKEDYDEVIQEVSNNLSSIINAIEKLEQDAEDMEDDIFNIEARKVAEGINRTFRKSVSKGGLGLPLSNPIYKNKYPIK